MPRSERLYLSDIVTAAEAIEGYVEGLSFDDFVGLDIVRRAVLQRLTEIGEAASRLSPAFRTHHADIPWSDIVGFRNIAVHAYLPWTGASSGSPRPGTRLPWQRE